MFRTNLIVFATISKLLEDEVEDDEVDNRYDDERNNLLTFFVS